jgi:hypothetical protein
LGLGQRPTGASHITMMIADTAQHAWAALGKLILVHNWLKSVVGYLPFRVLALAVGQYLKGWEIDELYKCGDNMNRQHRKLCKHAERGVHLAHQVMLDTIEPMHDHWVAVDVLLFVGALTVLLAKGASPARCTWAIVAAVAAVVGHAVVFESMVHVTFHGKYQSENDRSLHMLVTLVLATSYVFMWATLPKAWQRDVTLVKDEQKGIKDDMRILNEKHQNMITCLETLSDELEQVRRNVAASNKDGRMILQPTN